MKIMVWLMLAILVYAYVSPTVGVVLGIAPVLFYCGAWYLAMRLLGVVK